MPCAERVNATEERMGAPEQPQKQNRPDQPTRGSAMDRRLPRHTCEMDAAIVVLDDGAPALRLQVKVRDISRGGAGVTLAIPIERGVPLVFLLNNPVAGGKRAVYAVSAGCSPDNDAFRIGIEFLPTPLQIRCQPWFCKLSAA